MRESVGVNLVGVGDQEKRSWKPKLVENGDGALELAPQSIVEGKGNK
jgi:hypothetical protein